MQLCTNFVLVIFIFFVMCLVSWIPWIPNFCTPAPWGNFLFYLSAFFSLCNGYFSQTQSLPKLNTLDLSLVYIENAEIQCSQENHKKKLPIPSDTPTIETVSEYW